MMCINERIQSLKQRIAEADSKLYMEGYDPTPELISELQRVCEHDSVDVIDGYITCTICGKQFKRYERG